MRKILVFVTTLLLFFPACFGNLRPISYQNQGTGTAPVNQTNSQTGTSANGAELDLSLAIGGPALITPPSNEDAFPSPDELCPNTFGPTGSVPKLIPGAYVQNCAGCHGPDGSGSSAYPSLQTQSDYNRFLNVLRQGISDHNPVMPVFDSTHLDESDIRRIFAWLAQKPLIETPKNCVKRPVPTAQQIALDYNRGIQAFRNTSTDRDGRSCVQCHAADGLTFAYLGISDGDILRRANTHLVGSDPMAVVDMVHALKARYNLPRRDPLLSRPFQPGTIPTAGATIAERDKNFGEQLADFNLIIATKPINSTADALAAEQQLISLNLHALRVPLVFNRYSEDIFHNDKGLVLGCPGDIDSCDDHGSIADWVPIAPHTLTSPASFFAAHDAYLKQTSWVSGDLQKVLSALPNINALEGDYPSFQNRYLDDLKWRSEYLLDFCIRQEITGANPNCYSGQPLSGSGAGQNPWNIGSYAKRIAEAASGYTGQTGCDIGFVGCDPPQPQMLYNNITPGAKLSDNMQRLGNPWFALQWQHFDPALMSTGDNTAQLSEYFTRALFWADNDGDHLAKAINPAYSNYAAFHVVMHNVSLINQPSTYDCNSKMPFFHPDLGALACTAVDIRSGLYPEMTSFAEGKSLFNDLSWQIAYMPKDQPRRARYQLLAGNMHRLFLWKLVGALQQDNWMCRADIEKLRIARAQTLLNTAEIKASNGPFDAILFSALSSLMASSKTSCPAFNPNP